MRMTGSLPLQDLGYAFLHSKNDWRRKVTGPEREKDFISTDITGDFAGYLSTEASQPPPSDPSPRETEVARPREVPPSCDFAIIDLAGQTIRGQLKHWWLSRADVPQAIISPSEIVGAVIRNHRVKTSPIVCFDPESRRVQTRSGHVYALGMPEVSFAAHGRLVLRRLGF
jgi:hypothetical protein